MRIVGEPIQSFPNTRNYEWLFVFSLSLSFKLKIDELFVCRMGKVSLDECARETRINKSCTWISSQPLSCSHKHTNTIYITYIERTKEREWIEGPILKWSANRNGSMITAGYRVERMLYSTIDELINFMVKCASMRQKYMWMYLFGIGFDRE